MAELSLKLHWKEIIVNFEIEVGITLVLLYMALKFYEKTRY